MEMVSPVSTGARWIGIVATTRPSQARMDGIDGEFVGEWIEWIDSYSILRDTCCGSPEASA